MSKQASSRPCPSSLRPRWCTSVRAAALPRTRPLLARLRVTLSAARLTHRAYTLVLPFVCSAYENVGAFGKQGLSDRNSFPLFGFGTSNRENVSKVFLSSAHEKSKHGLGSPGPAALYERKGALAGHEYGFGSDDRFQRLGRHLADASELPGPGSYDHDSTFNTQHSSSRRTDSSYGFGTSNRAIQVRLVSQRLYQLCCNVTAATLTPLGQRIGSKQAQVPMWGAQGGGHGRVMDLVRVCACVFVTIQALLTIFHSFPT